MMHEMKHMTTSAETDPMKTSHRLCDIARMAAMKKVLSPISMLRIMRNVFTNPENHPLFACAFTYVKPTEREYVFLIRSSQLSLDLRQWNALRYDETKSPT